MCQSAELGQNRQTDRGKVEDGNIQDDQADHFHFLVRISDPLPDVSAGASAAISAVVSIPTDRA